MLLDASGRSLDGAHVALVGTHDANLALDLRERFGVASVIQYDDEPGQPPFPDPHSVRSAIVPQGLPGDPASIDVAISIGPLVRLADPVHILGECRRLLADDGLLLLWVEGLAPAVLTVDQVQHCVLNGGFLVTWIALDAEPTPVELSEQHRRLGDLAVTGVALVAVPRS